MPAPENYLLNIPDPVDTMMQGIKQGSALNSAQTARKQQEAAMTKQAALQAAISKLRSNSPLEDWTAAANQMDPEAAKQLMGNWELLNKEQRVNKLQQSQQLFVALNQGEKGAAVAKQLAQQIADGYRESGDGAQAKAMEDWIKIIDISPEAAAQAAGALIAAVDKDSLQGALDLLKNPAEVEKLKADTEAQKVNATHLRTQASKVLSETMTIEEMRDVNKEHVAAQIRKLDAETAKMKVEAENYIATGGMDANERFSMETQVRTEWTKASGAYFSAVNYYSRVNASYQVLKATEGQNALAKDLKKKNIYPKDQAAFDKMQAEGTIPRTLRFESFKREATAQGVADMAMVFAFMKLLDPTSVVRESEYANAKNAKGVDEKVRTWWNNLMNGDILSADQREYIMSLSKEYADSAKEQSDAAKERLMPIVESYGLSSNNVFGEEKKRLSSGDITAYLSRFKPGQGHERAEDDAASYEPGFIFDDTSSVSSLTQKYGGGKQ